MTSIHKTPFHTGKAAAGAVATAVIACGVCCIPLASPLALTLLASLGLYSANDVLINGWGLAAVALLVSSPLMVWWWRRRLHRSAPPACATDCSCSTDGRAQTPNGF